MSFRSLVATAFVVAVLCIGASTAKAVRMKILAINSGADITAPYDNFQYPTMTPGAKGFLIGIEKNDNIGFLSVANIMFSGNIVHLQAQNDAGAVVNFPYIMTRTEAHIQGQEDRVNYRREDTYLMNNAQAGASWQAVIPLSGGLATDNFFGIGAATLGMPSNVPKGDYQLAYIVATGDVRVSGFIVSGVQGQEHVYGLGSGFFGQGRLNDRDSVGRLSYLDEQLYFPSGSEPSSFVLAGLATIAVVWTLRRRAKHNRG